MPFTISNQIPPLVYGLEQPFVFQPAMASGSTPAATGWSATGLPAGVAINATTGKISGAATEVGVFSVVLTATGSGGASDTQSLQIGITDRVGYEATMGGACEMRVDMRSGYLWIPNVAPVIREDGTRGALTVIKRNDVKQFALAFDKDNENQDLLVVDLKIALKSTEPGATVYLSSGLFWKIGQYQDAYFLFEASITDEVDELLAEEEDDEGTFVDMLAEVQAVYHWYPPGTNPEAVPAPTPREMTFTSQEFYLRISRDWIPEE